MPRYYYRGERPLVRRAPGRGLAAERDPFARDAETSRAAALYRILRVNETYRRRVRSFVRRPGRITAAQKSALTRLMPVYGIPFAEACLDLDAAFGRSAPRVLDIGFGDGEALLTLAANNPDVDFLGVEVHEPGIGHLLVLLERAGLTNVRVVDRDVVDVVAAMLPDAGFEAVNLLFPDPWPKKRHHKRRLVQPPFVEQLARVLKAGGLLHLATDWSQYAEHAREVLAQSENFVQEHAEDLCHNRLARRVSTKFERRGRQRGHDIVDLYYRRRARSRTADSPDA